MPASPPMTPGALLHRVVVMGAAITALGLGSAFHTAAGGFLPGAFGLAVIGLLVWTSTASIYRSGRGALSLITSVAVGQAVVHLALTAMVGHEHAAGTRSFASPRPETALATDASAGLVIPGSLTDALGVNGLPADALGNDPVALALHRLAEEMTLAHSGMGLAHAAAGALVGLWLVIGQRALLTLIGLWSAPVLATSIATRSRLLIAALSAVAPRLKPLLRLPQPPPLQHQQRSRTDVLRGPPRAHMPARITLRVTGQRVFSLV